MGNGSYDLPHVATVQQRDDNTIVVDVQTNSYYPGQEVEVSVNLTQGSAYAAHYEKKRIPIPDPGNPQQPPAMHVELPATKLDEGQAVTVITRVTEVWPTVLQPASKSMSPGLRAMWTYQDQGQDTEGKGPGDSGSPSGGNGGGGVTAPPP